MRLFEGTQFDRPPRCERCEELEADCQCPPPEEPRTPVNNQTARLAKEKRKRGKVVTVIRNLLDEGTHLADLLTALKNHCGAGGTIQNGDIEIQGEQLDRIRPFLTGAGYKVKG